MYSELVYRPSCSQHCNMSSSMQWTSPQDRFRSREDPQEPWQSCWSRRSSLGVNRAHDRPNSVTSAPAPPFTYRYCHQLYRLRVMLIQRTASLQCEASKVQPAVLAQRRLEGIQMTLTVHREIKKDHLYTYVSFLPSLVQSSQCSQWATDHR